VREEHSQRSQPQTAGAGWVMKEQGPRRRLDEHRGVPAQNWRLVNKDKARCLQLWFCLWQ
jgi:hypothetical protein